MLNLPESLFWCGHVCCASAPSLEGDLRSNSFIEDLDHIAGSNHLDVPGSACKKYAIENRLRIVQ